jgi:hypothetical protein
MAARWILAKQRKRKGRAPRWGLAGEVKAIPGTEGSIFRGIPQAFKEHIGEHLPPTKGISEPRTEVVEAWHQLFQSDRMQNLQYWHRVNLFSNSRHQYDLYFNGNQFVFEYRSLIENVVRRSVVYSNREYAYQRYHKGRIRWATEHSLGVKP